METKRRLRQQFIAKRKAMPLHIVAEKSLELSNKISSEVQWNTIESLHCFLPLVDDNEPDMRPLIESAILEGCKVYVSDPPGRQVDVMQNSKFQSELRQYKLSDDTKFSLIIVPMLAYDPESKHRLGFGGGFYDRMLAGQKTAQKIGVCFSEFATELPVEPHDQALDMIIVA